MNISPSVSANSGSTSLVVNLCLMTWSLSRVFDEGCRVPISLLFLRYLILLSHEVLLEVVALKNTSLVSIEDHG